MERTVTRKLKAGQVIWHKNINVIEMESTQDNKADCIIIGAGIAGLLLARDLAKAGANIIVLEALSRVGGRIQTIRHDFSSPVELGAEFVHGDLPITKQLLKEAEGQTVKQKGLIYERRANEIVRIKSLTGKFSKELKKLRRLEENITLARFFRDYLDADESADAIKAMTRLAEGFVAAEADKISSLALKDEWDEQNLDHPTRIKQSHALLVEHLHSQCVTLGVRFYLNSPVTEIRWNQGNVRAQTNNSFSFEGASAAITLSVGLLKCIAAGQGNPAFIPPINDKLKAADDIGFGPVIKIIIEFNVVFWETSNGTCKHLKDPGFLLNEGMIPIWWTRRPEEALLVGWAGGPSAKRLENFTDVEIFVIAIKELSEIFGCSVEYIDKLVKAYKIANWGAYPSFLGAYSYATPSTKEARIKLSAPVEDTLYFCGEALSQGESMGTVEAALESASETAKMILSAR
jgi:monoamine oxidase